MLRGVLAQEIHHRVKNNLQTVASLLRLQAASADTIDPQKALGDSVNRILAIAAVHEVLTERRDDDVDLGELVDRLRSMLVQGLGGGKQVSSHLEPISLHGERATALALVFCELLGNALEHGGDEVLVELGRSNGRVLLTVADNGSWSDDAREGTGLSIVRALVREELDGESCSARITVCAPRWPSPPRSGAPPIDAGLDHQLPACVWRPTSPSLGSSLSPAGARMGREFVPRLRQRRGRR